MKRAHTIKKEERSKNGATPSSLYAYNLEDLAGDLFVWKSTPQRYNDWILVQCIAHLLYSQIHINNIMVTHHGGVKSSTHHGGVERKCYQRRCVTQNPPRERALSLIKSVLCFTPLFFTRSAAQPMASWSHWQSVERKENESKDGRQSVSTNEGGFKPLHKN